MPATSNNTTGDYGAPEQFIELRERYFNVVPEFQEDSSSEDDRSSAYHPNFATASNVTSPFTADSQFGAPVTSGQQIGTASSRFQFDQSASPDPDGQTVESRRAYQSAQRDERARSAQNLLNDDRPATRSAQKSARRITAKSQGEDSSGTYGDDLEASHEGRS
jgi:hypothetical protein